jgi:hypothetical protein
VRRHAAALDFKQPSIAAILVILTIRAKRKLKRRRAIKTSHRTDGCPGADSALFRRSVGGRQIEEALTAAKTLIEQCGDDESIAVGPNVAPQNSSG